MSTTPITTEAAVAEQAAETETIRLETPSGLEIVGTLERMAGRGEFSCDDTVELDPDGWPAFELNGTDVWHDEQKTVHALNGSPIFIAADGTEWVFDRAKRVFAPRPDEDEGALALLMRFVSMPWTQTALKDHYFNVRKFLSGQAVETDQQKALATYHKLHDGLSDMVEDGRLDETLLGLKKYQWLVEALANLCVMPANCQHLKGAVSGAHLADLAEKEDEEEAP